MLLDANVLVALLTRDHEFHHVVRQRVRKLRVLATCPITELALVRFIVRVGGTAWEAVEVLERLSEDDRHQAWSDDVMVSSIDLRMVIGHRQVTDAYLAGLARAHDDRILTLDRGLAAVHADVAELLTP